jgi:hypothetical protein
MVAKKAEDCWNSCIDDLQKKAKEVPRVTAEVVPEIAVAELLRKK